MTYRIGLGHDLALESLTPLDPQPATPGMLFGRRSYALSSDVIDELPYVPFRYSAFGTIEEYQSVLSQFGLLTALTSLVTVYVQDRTYDWVLRNGVAVAPLIGQDGQRNNFFLRDFEIVVHGLRAQA